MTLRRRLPRAEPRIGACSVVPRRLASLMLRRVSAGLAGEEAEERVRNVNELVNAVVLSVASVGVTGKGAERSVPRAQGQEDRAMAAPRHAGAEAR